MTALRITQSEKEIGERLSAIVTAHHGRYSSEPAAYGLPVRKPARRAARKPVPAPAPAPASMIEKRPANGATVPASEPA